MTHPTRYPKTALTVGEAMSLITNAEMIKMCLAVNTVLGTAAANRLLDLFGTALAAARDDLQRKLNEVADKELKEADRYVELVGDKIDLKSENAAQKALIERLVVVSRQFQVFETSNLQLTTNRDTGEASIQFVNEHKQADGKPLSIPNRIIIAIPVFRGGAAYRLPVRFRYRKSGADVKFILSPYNPEKAFEAAFDEACQTGGALYLSGCDLTGVTLPKGVRNDR